MRATIIFLFVFFSLNAFGVESSEPSLEKRVDKLEKELEKSQKKEKELESEIRELKKNKTHPIPPSTTHETAKEKDYPWVDRKSMIKVFDRDFGNELPLPKAYEDTRAFHSAPIKDLSVFLPYGDLENIPSNNWEGYVFGGMDFQGFVDVRFIFDEDKIADGVESFSFELGEFELDIIKRFPRIAFLRSDLDFDSDGASVEQLYGGALVPWGNALEFRFGKFNSPMGSQGVDAPTKDLISTSMVQGLGLPENFLGVWFSYPFLKWMKGYFIVGNGWDLDIDNNEGKTLMGRLEFAPNKNLVLGMSGGGGPEQPNADSHWRYFANLDAIFTPYNWLKLTFDFVWGFEESAPVGFGPGGFMVFNDSDWFGLQVGGVARIWRWLDFALRYEYFDDDNGARVFDQTLFRSLAQKTPNSAVKVQSVSGQVNFHFVEGADIRVEWQYNNGDGPVFLSQKGGFIDQENVITFQGLFIF